MKTILNFNKNTSKTLILVILVSFLNTACWLSPKEAARFAKAGSTYTTAMDLLLVRSGDLSIDANSEFTLHLDSIANVTSAQYMTLRNKDRERLKEINRLRRHTKMLARYFELLYELSTSKAPEETATALNGLVGNINKVGMEIRGSNYFTAAARAAVGAVGNLIVTAQIRQAVNKEFEARKNAIRRELVTQEELLKILASDIQQNLNIGNATKEQRLVVAPLTGVPPIGLGDINKWKENRREAIRSISTIDDLETASDAVKKLREGYESLLSGKLDISRINDALKDFEIIISTSEAIKEAIGGERK